MPLCWISQWHPTGQKLPSLLLHPSLPETWGWRECFRRPLRPAGILRAERPAPVADGLVGDGDSTLRQEVLDVSEAQAEPVVQPDGVADDLGWEPMTAVAGCRAVHLATLPPMGSS